MRGKSQHNKENAMKGKVYLIGAGPGDPELITVKGLRLIKQADVIIYDRLIPTELLGEAKVGAELINAGKAPTKHRLSQEDINKTIVHKAQQGKMVIRLKGGDPFVFGRGSEEALVCYEHGIPFEIVSGVSSSFAVPAYAGIPLTHRELSSNFTVLTAHDPHALPYEALAKLGGTLVILMGVNGLATVIEKLSAAGLASDTPAAMIEWGTTTRQRVVEGSVGNLVQLSQEAQIDSPAITVIGEVVRLRVAGLQWFDLLPEEILQNKAV
jgi:uroporphyrin-III C-methyltransferase